MRADSAIAVSGMLNATVVSNPLATYILGVLHNRQRLPLFEGLKMGRWTRPIWA